MGFVRRVLDSDSLGRVWVISTVVYGVIRVVLVRQFLGQYGVNATVFAVVELTSATGLGVFSARLVRRAAEDSWIKAATFGVLTLVCYAAPDVFVFLSVGRLPRDLLVVLVSIVFISALISAATVWRRVKSAVTESGARQPSS